MDIVIHHCTRWGYQPKAASLAARIEKELGLKARLKPGRPGQYDVTVDGEVVATKDSVTFWKALLGNKGIPEEERVLEALRQHQQTA